MVTRSRERGRNRTVVMRRSCGAVEWRPLPVRDRDEQAVEMLDIRDGRRWRAWLEKRHASSSGVWLVFHKDHTGVPSIPYEDAVREALCYGWIDSLIKRLDDERYARKFTPRKPTSKWSESTRRGWLELKAAGRLAPAGLAAAPTASSDPPVPDVRETPAYIAKAFTARPRAWRAFEALPRGQQRLFVLWIHTAKRDETREKRIRESIALLEAGRRLGLK